MPVGIIGVRPPISPIVITTLLTLLIAALWSLFPHPLIALVAGIALLGLLLVIHSPVWVGLLFIAFSFFRLHEVFPQLYSFRIPLLLALGTLTTIGWHTLVTRNITPYNSRELSAFGIFFLLVTIGLLFAGNRPEAISYWSATFVKIGIMTLALAWLLRELDHFRFTLRLLTTTGLAVGLVTLYNKMNGIGLVEGTRVTIGRSIGSVLGDPNDLALVLLFPLSFALALWLTRGLQWWERGLGLVTSITLVSAIIATQSRGGLLGIAAICGIYGIYRIHSKLLLGGIGLVGMLGLYLLAGIGRRQSGGVAESGIDQSAMGRLHAWEAAIGMATDNPLTGVGLNNFYYNYFYYSPSWDGLNHAVHSTWFGVLAETGFVGLIAFVTMVTLTLRSSITTVHKVQHAASPSPPELRAISEGNLAGLVGFCISGTFLTQGFTWPIYILLALSVAVAHYVKSVHSLNLT